MSSSFPCNNSLKNFRMHEKCKHYMWNYNILFTHTHTCWNVDATYDLTLARKVTNSIMSNSLSYPSVCVCLGVRRHVYLQYDCVQKIAKTRSTVVHIKCPYPLTSLINKTCTLKCTQKLRFPLQGRFGSRRPGWASQPSPWWLRLPYTLLLIKTMGIWGIVRNWKHISQRGWGARLGQGLQTSASQGTAADTKWPSLLPVIDWVSPREGW